MRNTIKELKMFLILWSTQSLSQLVSAMTNFALTLWLYQRAGSALFALAGLEAVIYTDLATFGAAFLMLLLFIRIPAVSKEIKEKEPFFITVKTRLGYLGENRTQRNWQLWKWIIRTAKTVYLPEDRSYEYRPRRFYERDYPEMPYPEAESYTENADGTITLIVHAVYPKENTSWAFGHKTVMRLLEDGTFQYVSNQMIFSGEKYDAWGHTERASEEEREAMYGGEKKTEDRTG